MKDEVERWSKLTDEERLLENSYYKREYEGAYEFFDKPVPRPWEELTHEERDKVRQQCIAYQRRMDVLGNAIRDGKLP
jgi:predicted Fe-S protein YdhL (DUF1289 family)